MQVKNIGLVVSVLESRGYSQKARMNFGGAGNKMGTPKAPEKGAFPLDHYAECRNTYKAYMNCLKSNANDAGSCRLLAKEYLQCRMDRGLMEPVDDWEDLGLPNSKEEGEKAQAAAKAAAEAREASEAAERVRRAQGEKEGAGWVSGAQGRR